MLEDDRAVGIGALNKDGWWNFERIDLFKALDDSIIFEKHARVTIKSTPPDGEFRIQSYSGKNLFSENEIQLKTG